MRLLTGAGDEALGLLKVLKAEAEEARRAMAAANFMMTVVRFLSEC